MYNTNLGPKGIIKEVTWPLGNSSVSQKYDVFFIFLKTTVLHLHGFALWPHTKYKITQNLWSVMNYNYS